jgi:hypothetical protein
MVSLTLSLHILIVSVVDPLTITPNRRRRTSSRKRKNVLSMQGTSELRIRRVAMEYGVVAVMKIRMESHAPRRLISLLSGLMKKPRSISSISP